MYKVLHDARIEIRQGYAQDSPAAVRPHELSRRFQLDLDVLELGEHFASGPRTESLALTRAVDIEEAERPTKGASILYPYRTAWGILVDRRCRLLSEEVLRKEARVPDQLPGRTAAEAKRVGSRLAAYVLGRYSDAISPFPLDAPAPWLKWNLPRGAQHRLLALRAQGSVLQSHATSAFRRDTPYEELYCPLCIGQTKGQELETFHHAYLQCPTMEDLRKRIDDAAQLYMEEAPFTWHRDRRKAHPSSAKKVTAKFLAWRDIPADLRVRLLIGDLPAESGPLAMGPWWGKKDIWVEGLLRATLDSEQTGALLECRLDRVRQLESQGVFAGGSTLVYGLDGMD